MKPSLRAFTLIELLTVIAVIGVLAGILIPVVSKARASARVSVCGANMRQIGTAIDLYVADNKGRYPYAYYVPAPDSSDTQRKTWDTLISPYLFSVQLAGTSNTQYQVMLCPSDADPMPDGGQAKRTYAMVRGSDGFGITTNGDASTPRVGRSRAEVEEPAKTLLLAEYSQHPSTGGSWNMIGHPANSAVDSPVRQLASGNGAELHGGKFNYLFADGHVQFLSPDATVGTGSTTAPKGMWTLRAGD